MKVNLKDIQDKLVKRGRDAYVNPDLSAELLALTPDEDDAFIFVEAQGDPTDADYVNHKNLWRNRVKTVATQAGIDADALSIQWTTAGEMVVSYRKR
jgi:hypothetical protein